MSRKDRQESHLILIKWNARTTDWQRHPLPLLLLTSPWYTATHGFGDTAIQGENHSRDPRLFHPTGLPGAGHPSPKPPSHSRKLPGGVPHGLPPSRHRQHHPPLSGSLPRSPHQAPAGPASGEHVPDFQVLPQLRVNRTHPQPGIHHAGILHRGGRLPGHCRPHRGAFQPPAAATGTGCRRPGPLCPTASSLPAAHYGGGILPLRRVPPFQLPRSRTTGGAGGQAGNLPARRQSLPPVALGRPLRADSGAVRGAAAAKGQAPAADGLPRPGALPGPGRAQSRQSLPAPVEAAVGALRGGSGAFQLLQRGDRPPEGPRLLPAGGPDKGKVSPHSPRHRRELLAALPALPHLLRQRPGSRPPHRPPLWPHLHRRSSAVRELDIGTFRAYYENELRKYES